jgi:hypothetical protein
MTQRRGFDTRLTATPVFRRFGNDLGNLEIAPIAEVRERQGFVTMSIFAGCGAGYHESHFPGNQR